MKRLFFTFLFLSSIYSNAQEKSKFSNDTIQKLKTVIVIAKQQSPERMPETKDNILFSGKKNEVLKLSSLNANLTNNNAREVFARIPGVTVWENEGSGLQINVGVRGLNPNRSWELNTRQNGVDISADVFGYPEAYYNPPLEAVETIQFVRGGASLQFGPQFGGMLNYVLKREKEQLFSFETQNAVGSFGMVSSFNAIGGKYKKFSYYVYNHSRSAKGWRENNRFQARNTHAFLEYRFTDKTKISAEYTNSDYEMQQPGGLTDAQFATNSKDSFRDRNWFGVPWNIFSVNFDSRVNANLDVSVKAFGLIGERNSVGFTSYATVTDAISTTTNQYANRRVDYDTYKNLGVENRNLYRYNLGKIKNNLAFGMRLYQAKTERFQKGKGTTASNFDMSIEGRFPTELAFATKNAALFAENQFKINEKFSVTPGVRYEHINSTANGRIDIDSGNNDVTFNEKNIVINKPLLGIGLEYKWKQTNFYANISEAYRPVLFGDLTPPAVRDVIDPNLKESNGYNADLGYRGVYKKFLNFDVSVFYLSYQNRVGGITQFVNNDPTKDTYLFRTNLGETRNKGIESFVDLNITKMFGVNKPYGNLDIFASMSFIDSRYVNQKVIIQSVTTPIILIETNLSGNRVENAPRYIHNFGISWGNNNISATVQYKMSGKIFTDSGNSIAPSANGQTGLLYGYEIMDFSSEYKFYKKYNLRAGINNLLNKDYATRRAGGYPGPGILPGEGRSFYVSIGAKF
jgi:Fe(3+) dicitrate transport protein